MSSYSNFEDKEHNQQEKTEINDELIGGNCCCVAAANKHENWYCMFVFGSRGKKALKFKVTDRYVNKVVPGQSFNTRQFLEAQEHLKYILVFLNKASISRRQCLPIPSG